MAIPIKHTVILYILSMLLSFSKLNATNDSLANLPKDTISVHKLYELAMNLRLKDSARATMYANKMLLLSEKLEFIKGQADAYYVMGRIAFDYNAHEQAIALLKKGSALYEKADYNRGVLECCYRIARCCRRIADYPAYQKYLALLEEQAAKFNNKVYQSYAYEGYGNLYRYLGDYPQSLTYYMKAIELSEELGNMEDVSGALNNMSLVYGYQGKPEEALKIQTRNYEILKKLDKKSDMVLCLSNLSTTYNELKLKEKAQEYILKAMKIVDEAGPKNIAFKDLAAAYSQVASIAIEDGDYTKGLEYNIKDLELKQKNKDVKGVSDCYGNLAYVYELMKKDDLASEYLLKQLAIATGIGYVNGRLNAYKSLADLETKKGNYKTAQLYQKEYILIKDSMEIDINAKQITKIDTWLKVKEQQQQIELLSRDREIKELELKRRVLISYAFGGGFLLIFIVTLLLFKNNSKLKKAEYQLLAVNKELESFSYSISHDLRTPLRAIDSYAGIIVEDYRSILDNEGNRLLNALQANARKMGSLIDDLLAFSKIGKKELIKTTINMKELVDEVLTELNTSIQHKAQIKIGELPVAKGDYRLIKQVVVNLVSNAIKYSKKVETPLVEINAEKKDAEIIYTVKDNGAGFDMRYANKLFGVFQRLHTADEFEGTGAGLAIVRRIITKHGGKVWAEAEVGKGATFKFSLPIK